MTDSSMLKYQYGTILDQLILLQLHAESPDCPCSLQGTHPGELGEFCEPKHLRSIVALARETIAMEDDEAKVEYLENLVLEGSELLGKMERKLCGKEVDLGDYVTWARDKRKPLEAWCYSGFCDLAQVDEALMLEVAQMFRKKREPRWCYPVKETDKELGKLSRTLGTAKKRIAEIQRHLEMPINICRGQAEMFESATGVLDPYGSRCRNQETGLWAPSEECGFEPAGITTSALGMDGLTRYEFEFKLVPFDKLVVSHDPFTFAANPQYPQELQPRLRERAATKMQVEKIAANLEPEAVITDFHVIDRGTPIIGQDSVVEAGNGRVMGIIKAAADYPDKYTDYKNRLRERASDYGLSAKDVDAIENPILVRVRITDVDRTTFAQEANQAATIAPSAIENARTDAQKITQGMLQELKVGEDESLEDALRAPKNQVFAKRFLSTLPENVQASLVDAQGYLNRDGVHRMAMAIFVSAFQGDSGLRLAEKAFESVSMDVRNTVNAIARSLGPLAQAESLIRDGERDTALSIGDDLAQTINVYSAIKRNPSLTVEKYLAQEQIFARELTPFQENILVVLEEYKKSPKKLAGVFTAYAEGVISAPPPAQTALFPGAEITKEGLWDSAIITPEPPMLMEVIRMFEKLGDAKYGLIPAIKVEITRAEGLHSEVTGKPEVCTRDASFGIWSCADHILVKWSNTAPKEGGYDKCDFIVTWEDGETYKGRYDLKHHSIEYPDLAKHVYGFLIFHAGLKKPGHMSNEEYRNYLNTEPASSMIPQSQHFLQTYEIGSFNVIEQVTELAEIAKLFAPMKLLTKEIRDKLPPLYSQENVEDPIVQVKFFTPDSNWTWYATEFDPKQELFFGWVVGFEKELGYFSLKEMESARGPMGLAIERDKWFKPMPLSEVKKLHQHEGGELAQGVTSIKCGQVECYLNSKYLIGDVWAVGQCTSPEIELRRTGVIENGLFLLHCKTAKRVSPALGKARGELAQGTMAAIGSAAITGIGIGAGFKFIDWLVKKFKEEESAVSEEEQEELEAVDEALDKAEEVASGR